MTKRIHAATDVPVIYIGPKAEKVDKTFGTRLKFKPGQTQLVVSNIASQMLEHRQVYTTTDTDELKAFIEANPLAASQQGLIDLPEDERTALEAAMVKDEAGQNNIEDDEDIIIEPNSEGVEDTEQLGVIKEELQTLVNKGQIAEWCVDHAVDVELSGTRTQQEEQAANAYAKKYLG